jgi:tRNA (mo5U34)-methyltransferase
VIETVGQRWIGEDWPSEREVAWEVPIEATPLQARRVLEAVPLWFHTFALNRGLEIYTPGKARDHGYRLASIPDSFAGLSVLDVGAFDGFYSFLAEARGAKRVLAIDNEQYLAWVRERWGVRLTGGEGFREIHRLRDSCVEYRRLDAFALEQVEERFDFIFCFGLLHRVENPLGLLRGLTSRLAEGGRMLIETYGTGPERDGSARGALHVPKPGEIYAHDRFVFWQFTPGSLTNLLSFTGHTTFELHAVPLVDGHPRLIGEVR